MPGSSIMTGGGFRMGPRMPDPPRPERTALTQGRGVSCVFAPLWVPPDG